jgi:hypothetical protein
MPFVAEARSHVRTKVACLSVLRGPAGEDIGRLRKLVRRGVERGRRKILARMKLTSTSCLSQVDHRSKTLVRWMQ